MPNALPGTRLVLDMPHSNATTSPARGRSKSFHPRVHLPYPGHIFRPWTHLPPLGASSAPGHLPPLGASSAPGRIFRPWAHPPSPKRKKAPMRKSHWRVSSATILFSNLCCSPKGLIYVGLEVLSSDQVHEAVLLHGLHGLFIYMRENKLNSVSFALLVELFE